MSSNSVTDLTGSNGEESASDSLEKDKRRKCSPNARTHHSTTEGSDSSDDDWLYKGPVFKKRVKHGVDVPPPAGGPPAALQIPAKKAAEKTASSISVSGREKRTFDMLLDIIYLVNSLTFFLMLAKVLATDCSSLVSSVVDCSRLGWEKVKAGKDWKFYPVVTETDTKLAGLLLEDEPITKKIKDGVYVRYIGCGSYNLFAKYWYIPRSRFVQLNPGSEEDSASRNISNHCNS